MKFQTHCRFIFKGSTFLKWVLLVCKPSWLVGAMADIGCISEQSLAFKVNPSARAGGRYSEKSSKIAQSDNFSYSCLWRRLNWSCFLVTAKTDVKWPATRDDPPSYFKRTIWNCKMSKNEKGIFKGVDYLVMIHFNGCF